VELLSEEEQWERLKAWLRTNGPSILVLTALMLLAFFGWKWWQQRGDSHAVAAGAMYDTIAARFDAGQDAEALALVETLREEHAGSPYVDAADLMAANVHVSNNELDKAVERLQRVATSAKDELLRPVARLRLARVQSAQGQYDAALATLGTAPMGEHEPARLEIRGDVLLAQGDRAAALQEYQAARKLLPAAEQREGGVRELLDLKIADLGGVPGADEPVEPAAAAGAPAASPAPAADAATEPATPASDAAQ
jgi:predicted negative regulator of RcsB-dependent stress response